MLDCIMLDCGMLVDMLLDCYLIVYLICFVSFCIYHVLYPCCGFPFGADYVPSKCTLKKYPQNVPSKVFNNYAVF